MILLSVSILLHIVCDVFIATCSLIDSVQLLYSISLYAFSFLCSFSFCVWFLKLGSTSNRKREKSSEKLFNKVG